MAAPRTVSVGHCGRRVRVRKPGRDSDFTAQPLQKKFPCFQIRPVCPSMVLPASAPLATGNIRQHVVLHGQLLAVASAE